MFNSYVVSIFYIVWFIVHFLVVHLHTRHHTTPAAYHNSSRGAYLVCCNVRGYDGLEHTSGAEQHAANAASESSTGS